ncbi:MAG: hypothetical protein WC850_03970 [Candidatus Gracilibacteria bacterium]
MGNIPGDKVKETITPEAINPIVGPVVENAQGEVSEKANKLLEKPQISIKMQRYLEEHNISEQNIPKCISLIKQIGEIIFLKKLESKGKKLKEEIEELLKNEDGLRDLVSKIIDFENTEEKKGNSKLVSTIIEIGKHELTSIIVETLEYEKRLVGQYRRNKDELLEKLKKSEEINVGGNKSSNNIASLTKEELTEIFSLAENATGLDISSYDLDLLNEEQLTAIFSNLKNIKIADLSGTNFTLGKAKLEIIFSNLQNCETLIFGENNVTKESLELMVKYLKNIKSIDFTMCELEQEQKDFIKDKFPNVDICIDEEEDVNP